MRRPLLAAAAVLALVPATPHAIARVHQPDPAVWQAALTAPWSAPGAPTAFTDQRALNPEYDFMARTFLVLALADRALAEPTSAERHAATIDAILTDTLAQDAAHGPHHWLLPYADTRPWRGDGRSLFVDGEVLVMLGARRLIADDRADWRDEMDRRAGWVEGSLGAAGPRFLAESYPNEGWTFCHTMALVGLRMHEVLDGADHRATRDAWLAEARATLIDPETGMLVSEFDLTGRVGDGPEGSSIWLAATALQVLDPDLARDQYTRAKDHLGRDLFGLGYAREWPQGETTGVDVDSGPIVPVLEASASSSGLALVAATAFGDDRWRGQLVTALGAAEAVLALDPELARVADNPVGRSVLLWGLGFGPVWSRLGAPPA